MRIDLVDCAMVLTLFGSAPVVATIFVYSLTKTFLVVARNSSAVVFFDLGIMNCLG
jgi:hypothetical protein